MRTATITLRDEDQRFVEESINSGRYSTASEVVSHAIAVLRARDELREARLQKLHSKIMEGIEQLERQEGAEWDLEEVKAKARALLSSFQHYEVLFPPFAPSLLCG